MTHVGIFTFSQDEHTNLVEKELIKLGANVWRIDTDTLWRDYCFSFTPTAKSRFPFELYSTNKRQYVPFDKLTSIWIRRPWGYSHEPTTPKEKMCEQELHETIRSILLSIPQNIKVIDPLPIVAAANKKSQQLNLAKKIGLNIPDTLITNSPQKAKEFFEKHNRNIIMKALGIGHAVVQNKVFGVFTTKVPKNVDFSLVQYTPTFFQEEIKKKIEYRVIIIGKKSFVVALDSQKLKETKLDWRKLTNQIHKLPHTPSHLPPKLLSQLFEMVNAFKLNYAAIDLALDTNGNYVFFELNPSGQFLWMEPLTNLPLASEMAKFLMGLQQK